MSSRPHMSTNLPPIDGRMDRLTPEGITLSLLPVGPAPRLWAYLIDQCVVLGLIFLLALVLASNDAGQGVWLLSLFFLWWGYPIVWEAFGGRTPGKRALKLRVVRVDGQPIGWKEAFLRGLLLTADFLPFLFLTGLVCMLFVPGFRRIGDLAAGTVVIQDEVVAEPSVPRLLDPESSPIPLLAHEQRALMDLAERSDHISTERLEELGDIASPYTGLRGKASVNRLRSIAAGLLK
ncbi:MAG: RDD family protein [Fibrobacteres bacterium]|nr:RDD family protein [Fibrobacterota bacterium]